MLNGGNTRAIPLQGRPHGVLACIGAACAVLLALLAFEGAQEFGWPVALAVLVSPFFVGWSIPIMPVAWRKARALVASIRGPHVIFALLLASCYIEQFFPTVGIRKAGDVEESPINAVNVVRIGLIALAGCFAIATALRARTAHWQRRRPGVPLLSMLVYAGIALVSASYASLPLVSAGKALEVIVDVVSFMILASLLDTEDLARYWNLFWMVLTLMIAGVWISAAIDPALGFEYQEGATFPILTGWLPRLHPNTLGQFAATLAIIGTARLLARGKTIGGREKMLWSSIIALGLVSMIAAQARTSLASFGVVLFLLLLWYRRLTLILATAIAGGLAMLAGVGDFLLDFVRRGQDAEMLTTLSGRTYYWQVAWDMFRESMAAGHGYYTAHRLDLTERFKVLDLSTVDNTYLEVLLDVGIIGIIPLVCALLWLLAALWRSRKIRMPQRWSEIRLEMIAFFIIALARSFTGPSFQVHGENLLLLLLVMSFTQSLRIKKQLRRVT